MKDVLDIKQGMIIFLPDASEGEDIVFKGESTPKKRRPWLIVSNDANNAFALNVSAVPIYTRTGVTIPTQVYFKHNDRDQVADCSSVTCVPKSCIDLRGFIGFVSKEVLKKVRKALSVQFSDKYDDNKEVTSAVKELLSGIDIQDIISTKLCEILINGLTNNQKTVKPEEISKPITNNKNVEEPVVPETTTIDNNNNTEVAENNQSSRTTRNTKNNKSVKQVKDVSKNSTEVKKNTKVLDNDKPLNTKNTKKTNRTGSYRGTKAPRAPYSTHGKQMTLEQCMEFYFDTEKLSVQQLYEKWSVYGVTLDRTKLAKKKFAIKQRLINSNFL